MHAFQLILPNLYRYFLAITLFFPLLVHGTDTIRVLTCNIRYDNPADGPDAWPVRKNWLTKMLVQESPAVIGIQEGLHRQVLFLDTVWNDYSRIGVGRDDGAEAGEYSAIFFDKNRFLPLAHGTFWLSPTPEKPSKGWDAALPRICTWVHLQEKNSQRSLYVFNMHFDHVGRTARGESAALVLEKIKAMCPENETIVVMGDLNAKPGEPGPDFFTKALKDARAHSTTPPQGPEGTFNGFKPYKAENGRIDYIYVSRNVEVLSYQVMDNNRNGHYPSDHFPVMAEIILP